MLVISFIKIGNLSVRDEVCQLFPYFIVISLYFATANTTAKKLDKREGIVILSKMFTVSCFYGTSLSGHCVVNDVAMVTCILTWTVILLATCSFHY